MHTLMAEDVAATVARLKSSVEAADRLRHQAEYARQQAEHAAAESAAALKNEFGVETPEQAKLLAADLDRQIAAEAAAVERALGGS